MMRWYNKSRRAQNPDDYETWIEGGVIPTMNGFDNGDIRTTTVILMRQREGKPGGGQRTADERGQELDSSHEQ